MILGATKLTPIINHINIWKRYPDIETFIDMFCFVDTHEALHLAIILILREENEYIVDRLM